LKCLWFNSPEEEELNLLINRDIDMVFSLQPPENARIWRAKRRAEERGLQATRALQRAPVVTAICTPPGVPGFPLLAGTSNISPITLKKDEIEVITTDPERNKSELQKEIKKPERKTAMGMETLLKPEESEPLYDSDSDWANQPSTSSFPLPTKTGKPLSPSYTPSTLPQRQGEAFYPEPPITTGNFSYNDVVRFGGVSPTPAEMLQIEEDRESAMNLSLQMQMEMDFGTLVLPTARGHMETAIDSILGEPEFNTVEKDEELAEQATPSTSFKHEIPVKTEEFIYSKTYLKKSKKAQKKLRRQKQ
jgi:hypothetical protein